MASAARTFRWLLAFAMAAILVLALLPPGTVPEPAGDKVNHVLAFASLTLLCHGALSGRPRRVTVLMIGFGALIELLQALTPYRQFSVLDLVADAVGITLGLAIAALIVGARRQANRSRA